MIELPTPMSLVFKEETGSTNSDAMDLARAGAADMTVVWALRQTAARGRYGRTWQASEGNLFWSAIVIIPEETPLDGLAISVAMAVFDTVRSFVPDARPLSIKWPNDVLIGGAKASGILIERNGAAGWAVVGIGINVAHVPDAASVSYPAASLASVGARVTLNEVCLALSHAFLRRVNTWRAEGFSPSLRAEYLSRLWRLNETVTIGFDADRRVTKSGRLLGINEAGHLLLDEDGAVSAIAAGDVF